jgi:DNA polymerase-3 subunit alpha
MEILDMDLHRHDEFSTFDGFDKAVLLAKIAKENGLDALGIANHGNVNGLVEHYINCKENGIIPILGCEVYYVPEFEEGQKEYYHLCLFCKDLKGYQNLNRIIYHANDKFFYYRPHVTWALLEKFHEGLICTSACIQGEVSDLIVKREFKAAYKAAKQFKELFGDDYYFEIMPYTLSEEGLQESINEKLMALASKLDIKCILTSDSHFGREDEFDSYLKMHEMKKSTIGEHYSERYMPARTELYQRFVDMHEDKKTAKHMQKNMTELIKKVDPDILDKLEDNHIVFDENINANEVLWDHIKKGLKKRGKWNQKYVDRCKTEYQIMVKNGFVDYFLIVEDYVNFAKSKGIAVGPGRGSVCNSEVAYVLGITDIDSIYFELDFTRFLREDKKKMPDIDLDFETDRRQEVIDYILKKYKGKSAQICSYGLYKVDNALNDLFKVCNVTNKEDMREIKTFVKDYIDPDTKAFDLEGAKRSKFFKQYNRTFDNIITHFDKMYRKVRFIGTHAAGVAIVGTKILDYAAIERRGDKMSCVFDLTNLEKLKVMKFDMLGLKTMSEIKELEDLTGETFNYGWLEDPAIYEQFSEGNTDGIFQFEKGTAKGILRDIHADCFNDVIAANAINRPGPLQLKMHQQYAHNKENIHDVKKSVYYKQTKDSYGTIVYQEQITAICREIGGMTFDQSDKMLKIMKGGNDTETVIKERKKNVDELRAQFVRGAVDNGLTKSQALDVFEKMIVYSFNKGHATGYAFIAAILMWYKVYYPEKFWIVKLKYGNKEMLERYKFNAVAAGNIVLLPHVNGPAEFGMVDFYGEECMQEGLVNIDGIGEKVAEAIVAERKKNGKFLNYQDFVSRMPKKIVNAGSLNALEQNGALEFKMKKWMARVEKYNIELCAKKFR